MVGTALAWHCPDIDLAQGLQEFCFINITFIDSVLLKNAVLTGSNWLDVWLVPGQCHPGTDLAQGLQEFCFIHNDSV